MKPLRRTFFVLLTTTVFISLGCAKQTDLSSQTNLSAQQTSSLHTEELDPFDPNIDSVLNDLDALYGNELSTSPTDSYWGKYLVQNCARHDCSIFAQVDLSEQRMSVFINQQLVYTWLVSTGAPGHDTPLLDSHPNGRIYDKYSSTKYPGGDYNGLGNMPYAVFIQGGFAVHGTPKSNWPKLGKKASHGCVRIHPDNAFIFNRLVRQYGIYATWIRIVP